MRVTKAWKEALDNGRLLVMSPFETKYKRVTASLSEERNRLVALLASDVFVSHAAPASKSEKLCKELIRSGKQVFTFEGDSNLCLRSMGAISYKAEACKAALFFGPQA